MKLTACVNRTGHLALAPEDLAENFSAYSPGPAVGARSGPDTAGQLAQRLAAPYQQAKDRFR